MYHDYLRGVMDMRTAKALFSIQRNNYAPVNILPTEILCMVFSICRDWAFEHSYPSGQPIVAISQTCTRWRQICLNSPTLWRKLDLNSRWARLSLDRSRGYPVQLALEFFERRCDDKRRLNLINLLKDSLHRAEDISMFGDTETILTAIIAPATNLKKLAITLKFDHDLYDLPQSFASSPVFNDPLFSSKAPGLRHLELSGFRMPWSRGYYQNLTTLKIDHCYVGQCADGEDEEICYILQDMPDLRQLELRLKKPTGWKAETDELLQIQPSIPQGGIPLKSLRTVILEVPAEYAKRILANIKAPLTKLSINVGEVDGPDLNVAQLMLPDTFPHDILPHMHRLSVCASRDGCAELVGRSFDHGFSFELAWTNTYPLHQLTIFTWIAEVMHANYTPPVLVDVVLESALEMPEGSHPFGLFTSFRTIRCLKLAELGAVSVLTGLLDAVPSSRPYLEVIQAYPLVEPEVTKAILELCRRYPRLRHLDFPRAVIQSTSRSGLVEFVQGLNKLDVYVGWFEAELEDLSTFDGYSPDDLLPAESEFGEDELELIEEVELLEEL